jgi:hypothetical protein
MGYGATNPAGFRPARPLVDVRFPKLEGCTTMVIVATFALLVLFSIVSIVMSAGDAERSNDPHDNPLFWATLGRR